LKGGKVPPDETNYLSLEYHLYFVVYHVVVNREICASERKMALYLKAYQAYQRHNFDQCLKLLQEFKSNDTKKLDLLAQIHFQKKEFQKAYDIYQDLLEKETEFKEERRENIQTLIVCAQLEQPGTLVVRGKDRLPSANEIIDQVQRINLKDESTCDLSLKPQHKNKKKKPKKRKQRLPKQYDPVAGPDPERWLPRRDRKGGAHRQKKRRQRPNAKGGGKARAK
jgi:tetratricopeptide (TPR) repeat protein